MNGYNWYNAPGATPTGSNAPTLVDARVRTIGALFTSVCEFKGTGLSAEKTRKCKFYDKSKQRSCCMYYRDDIEIGACDCMEK